MEVTLVGKLTSDKFVNSKKAFAQIDVTPYSITTLTTESFLLFHGILEEVQLLHISPVPVMVSKP